MTHQQSSTPTSSPKTRTNAFRSTLSNDSLQNLTNLPSSPNHTNQNDPLSDDFAPISRKRSLSPYSQPYHLSSRRRRSYSITPSPRHRSPSRSPSYHSPSISSKQIIEKMVVPSKSAGLVIGKSYEGIRTMSSASGARIVLDKKHTGPGCAFDVIGNSDQVRHCCRLISLRLDRSSPNQSDDDIPQKSYQMWIPVDKVGLVVGINGATIKTIKERSGAFATLQNDRQVGDRKPIQISGSQKAIERAREMIADIVEGLSSGFPTKSNDSNHDEEYDRKDNYNHESRNDRDVHNISNENHRSRDDDYDFHDSQLETKVLYIPQSVIGVIIGKRGNTLKSLQKRSGASIKVENDEDAKRKSERMVMITGIPNVISKAEQLIDETVKKANLPSQENRTTDNSRSKSNPGYSQNEPSIRQSRQSGVEEDIFILNAEHTRLLIGKSGSTVREMESRSGAIIEISGKSHRDRGGSTRTVSIFGNKTQMQIARLLMAEKLSVPDLSHVIKQGSTRGASTKLASSTENQERNIIESKERADISKGNTNNGEHVENHSEKDEGECSETYPPPEAMTINGGDGNMGAKSMDESRLLGENRMSKYELSNGERRRTENGSLQKGDEQVSKDKTSHANGNNGIDANHQSQAPSTEGIRFTAHQQSMPYSQYPQAGGYPHGYPPTQMYTDPSMNYGMYTQMHNAAQSAHMPNMSQFPQHSYMNPSFPPQGAYPPHGSYPTQQPPVHQNASDPSHPSTQPMQINQPSANLSNMNQPPQTPTELNPEKSVSNSASLSNGSLQQSDPQVGAQQQNQNSCHNSFYPPYYPPGQAIMYGHHMPPPPYNGYPYQPPPFYGAPPQQYPPPQMTSQHNPVPNPGVEQPTKSHNGSIKNQNHTSPVTPAKEEING